MEYGGVEERQRVGCFLRTWFLLIYYLDLRFRTEIDFDNLKKNMRSWG